MTGSVVGELFFITEADILILIQ